MGLASKHKKRLWYTAAVGGVAGLTGLAGINYVARVASPNSRAEVPAAAAAAPQVARPMADAKSNKDKNKNSGATESESDHYIRVPCDPEDLLLAIVRANAGDGATLKLAEDCTYSLTRDDEQFRGDGLPPITSPITIKGNGATIQRAPGGEVPKFRIFDVKTGGDLTLTDLTVKYGFAKHGGGGGLLVRQGGKATVQDVTFAFNQSKDEGGAIANYGITKVVGSDNHKDGVYGTGDNSGEMGSSGSGDDSDGLSNDSWADDQNDGSSDSWRNDGGDWKSLITRNSAEEGGGGVYNARYLTVEQTRLSYNAAADHSEGGGLLTDDGGVSLLRYVSVDHNTSKDDGGGIGNDDESTTALSYSYVANNSSSDDSGGIDNEGSNDEASSLFLQYTLVRNNTADERGGGIENKGKLVADHSWITGNTALKDGGGLYNKGEEANAVLRHSQVNLNRALDEEAGGIWNSEDSELHLTATEIAQNLSKDAPGGIQNENDNVGTEVTVDSDSAITKNRPTNCDGSSEQVPNCFG